MPLSENGRTFATDVLSHDNIAGQLEPLVSRRPIGSVLEGAPDTYAQAITKYFDFKPAVTEVSVEALLKENIEEVPEEIAAVSVREWLKQDGISGNAEKIMLERIIPDLKRQGILEEGFNLTPETSGQVLNMHPSRRMIQEERFLDRIMPSLKEKQLLAEDFVLTGRNKEQVLNTLVEIEGIKISQIFEERLRGLSEQEKATLPHVTVGELLEQDMAAFPPSQENAVIRKLWENMSEREKKAVPRVTIAQLLEKEALEPLPPHQKNAAVKKIWESLTATEKAAIPHITIGTLFEHSVLDLPEDKRQEKGPRQGMLGAVVSKLKQQGILPKDTKAVMDQALLDIPVPIETALEEGVRLHMLVERLEQKGLLAEEDKSQITNRERFLQVSVPDETWFTERFRKYRLNAIIDRLEHQGILPAEVGTLQESEILRQSIPTELGVVSMIVDELKEIGSMPRHTEAVTEKNIFKFLGMTAPLAYFPPTIKKSLRQQEHGVQIGKLPKTRFDVSAYENVRFAYGVETAVPFPVIETARFLSAAAQEVGITDGVTIHRKGASIGCAQAIEQRNFFMGLENTPLQLTPRDELKTLLYEYTRNGQKGLFAFHLHGDCEVLEPEALAETLAASGMHYDSIRPVKDDIMPPGRINPISVTGYASMAAARYPLGLCHVFQQGIQESQERCTTNCGVNTWGALTRHDIIYRATHMACREVMSSAMEKGADLQVNIISAEVEKPEIMPVRASEAPRLDQEGGSASPDYRSRLRNGSPGLDSGRAGNYR